MKETIYMTRMHKDDFEAIKAAVRAATPASWKCALRSMVGPRVVMMVTEAPLDLPGLDAELYRLPRRDYAKVCPTAYEDRADLPVAAIWRALHTDCTAQFDGTGDRAGKWHRVEMWFGDWRTPFVVAAAPANACRSLQTEFAHVEFANGNTSPGKI